VDSYRKESLVSYRKESLLVTYPHSLSILGTGDFGRALASLAAKRGIDVVLGSRNPNARAK